MKYSNILFSILVDDYYTPEYDEQETETHYFWSDFSEHKKILSV